MRLSVRRILAGLTALPVLAVSAPSIRAAGFTDLLTVPWAAVSIAQLSSQQVLLGVTPTQFDPQGFLTEAQWAVILARFFRLSASSSSSGSGQVSGVPAWAQGAVAAVLGRGLPLSLAGPTVGTDPVVRAVVAADLVSLLRLPLPSQGTTEAVLSGFKDAASVPSSLAPAVAEAVEVGLLQGSGGNLLPLNPFSRAQAAAVLARVENDLGTAPGGQSYLQGFLTAASASSITLTPPGGAPVTLPLAPSTYVAVNGQPASPGNLTQGQAVTVVAQGGQAVFVSAYPPPTSLSPGAVLVGEVSTLSPTGFTLAPLGSKTPITVPLAPGATVSAPSGQTVALAVGQWVRAVIGPTGAATWVVVSAPAPAVTTTSPSTGSATSSNNSEATASSSGSGAQAQAPTLTGTVVSTGNSALVLGLKGGNVPLTLAPGATVTDENGQPTTLSPGLTVTVTLSPTGQVTAVRVLGASSPGTLQGYVTAVTDTGLTVLSATGLQTVTLASGATVTGPSGPLTLSQIPEGAQVTVTGTSQGNQWLAQSVTVTTQGSAASSTSASTSGASPASGSSSGNQGIPTEATVAAVEGSALRVTLPTGVSASYTLAPGATVTSPTGQPVTLSSGDVILFTPTAQGTVSQVTDFGKPATTVQGVLVSTTGSTVTVMQPGTQERTTYPVTAAGQLTAPANPASGDTVSLVLNSQGQVLSWADLGAQGAAATQQGLVAGITASHIVLYSNQHVARYPVSPEVRLSGGVPSLGDQVSFSTAAGGDVTSLTVLTRPASLVSGLVQSLEGTVLTVRESPSGQTGTFTLPESAPVVDGSGAAASLQQGDAVLLAVDASGTVLVGQVVALPPPPPALTGTIQSEAGNHLTILLSTGAVSTYALAQGVQIQGPGGQAVLPAAGDTVQFTLNGQGDISSLTVTSVPSSSASGSSSSSTSVLTGTLLSYNPSELMMEIRTPQNQTYWLRIQPGVQPENSSGQPVTLQMDDTVTVTVNGQDTVVAIQVP